MTLDLDRPAQHRAGDPLRWSGHRFLALDGLRFVAALVVAMFHCSIWLDFGSIPRGYLAVDFFFMLSGFVLAFAYDERLRGGAYLLPFLRRRLIRLYPLCVFAAVLGFAINPNGRPRIRDMVLAFGLIPQFKEWLFPIDVPLWSLFFEVVVNVLYAAILIRLSDRKVLAIVAAAACCTLYYCCENGLIDAGGRADNWIFGLPRSLQSFGVGLLLCRWHRRSPGVQKTPSVLPSLALVPLTLLLFGTMWVPFVEVGNGVYDWIVVAAIFPLLLICGAMVDVGARIRPLLALGGELSYPLYVVHYPLLAVTAYVGTSGWQVKLASFCGILIAACALSYLVYAFFDRPVRRWLAARLPRPRWRPAP